jgi:PhnB protein
MNKPIKALDYGALSISLVVRDAKAAMAFYEQVFGAKHRYSLTMPDGSVAHGEFKIGDALLMISDENPQWGSKSPETLGGSPITLNVMVEDPDATVAKAEKAGAKVIFPVADQFYGFRSARFQDPFGHLWIVSKVLEELSPQEMQKRMDAMMAPSKEEAPDKGKKVDKTKRSKGSPEGKSEKSKSKK